MWATRDTIRVKVLTMTLAAAFAATGCDEEDNSELDALRGQVQSLITQLAAAETRITTLESEVSALSGGVSLSELRTDVDGLETNLAALDSEVTSNATAIAALDTDLGSLETTVSSLGTTATGLQGQIDSLDTAHADRLVALETKTQALAYYDDYPDDPDLDDKPALVISGVNLYVQSGSGQSWDSCTDTAPMKTACGGEDGIFTGLGNVIVGYNEYIGLGNVRRGSHNLVVGMDQSYDSFGGILAGATNSTTRPFGFVAGSGNNIHGPYGAIGGGGGNTVNGSRDTIIGGDSCVADEAATSRDVLVGDGTGSDSGSGPGCTSLP